MFNPRMVENFFKRTKFRRSKRMRSSLRASILNKSGGRVEGRAGTVAVSSLKDHMTGASVSTCDVSMISSQNSEVTDDVITLAHSDSFESITMSTVSIPSAVDQVQQQQKLMQRSPRQRLARPWTATGSSCASSCQPLAVDSASLVHGSAVVNGSAEGLRSGVNKDRVVTLTLVESLSREVEQLREELAASKANICKLSEKEKRLRDRLSEQAQRQLEKGTTKFEDISLGDNRPTQLVKRYGNLYSEGRLEAMDSLDELDEMCDCDHLKIKLLLSVVVLAFRSAQRTLEEMRDKVREVLYIPTTLESSAAQHRLAARELEETVSVYLRKTVDKHDVTSNYQEVCERVWATLFDYPSLRCCVGLQRYIQDCVRLAWALTVQNPPLVIDYESKEFDPDLHTRFHSSDPDSDVITTVLWPMLTEGEGGPCVYKGVVCT